MEKCGKYQWEIWNQLNGRNPCEFRTPRSKLGVNLQKSDCYGLDSERKKVLTSSPGPLACAYIHLGVFGSVGTHLPSVKSILPYFSSPRGVAILGCESHSQAGSAIFSDEWKWKVYFLGGKRNNKNSVCIDIAVDVKVGWSSLDKNMSVMCVCVKVSERE